MFWLNNASSKLVDLVHMSYVATLERLFNDANGAGVATLSLIVGEAILRLDEPRILFRLFGRPLLSEIRVLKPNPHPPPANSRFKGKRR
ncbi:hypothetical protein Btru_030486 [Bulinus truncatus]|nr:hypothetical protein Btru_030486 [Bulinus truncatus]